MQRVELRKELSGRIKLFNGKYERAEHPCVRGTDVFSLILQRRFEAETTRRKHSRIIDRLGEQSTKRSSRHKVSEVGSRLSLIRLIARGKLRSHAKEGAQLVAGQNCLDALLVFKGALFVVISKSPARLDAKKWSAVGPKSHIRDTGQIESHPPPTRRIDI